VRNAYYRQTSGQAVTGGEAARNFFAVVQPTDNASELLNKIKIARPRYADNLLSAVDDYELTPQRAERYRQLASQYGTARSEGAAGGAGATRTPTREEFIKAAKPLNPTLTDAQIGAEYDKKYGAKK
jgi:hypothetical protein